MIPRYYISDTLLNIGAILVQLVIFTLAFAALACVML
jgi:hypothetical protein